MVKPGTGKKKNGHTKSVTNVKKPGNKGIPSVKQMMEEKKRKPLVQEELKPLTTPKGHAKKSPIPTPNRARPVAEIKDNKLNSRVSPAKSTNTKANQVKETFKYSEDELSGYLNKIVGQHLDEAKKEVNKDLIDTSDCVYLNKFVKMANSDLINPEIMSPSKMARNNVIDDRESDALENFRECVSPEKLKLKYSSGGHASKHLQSESGKGLLSNSGMSSTGKQNKAQVDMMSILMDTETKHYVNDYKNQMEYLRMIIYNLDSKINMLNTYKDESGQLREEINRSNNSREELRKSLLETTQDLREESAKFNKVIVDLECHNRDILGSLRESYTLIDDLQGTIHRNEIIFAQLENENSQLRLNTKGSTLYKSQYEQSKADYDALQRKTIESYNNLAGKIFNLERGSEELAKERDLLCEQLKGSDHTIAKLHSEVNTERANVVNLRNELDNMNRKLKITQTSVELLSSVQEQRDQILKDLSIVRNQNDSSINTNCSIEKDPYTRSKDHETYDMKKSDEIQRLVNKVQQLELQLNESKAEVNITKKENIELKNHI